MGNTIFNCLYFHLFFLFFLFLFIFMIKSVYSSGCPCNSHASFPGFPNVTLKPLYHYFCFNFFWCFSFYIDIAYISGWLFSTIDILKDSVCLFLGYERFIFSFSYVFFYRDMKITWHKIFDTFHMEFLYNLLFLSFHEVIIFYISIFVTFSPVLFYFHYHN